MANFNDLPEMMIPEVEKPRNSNEFDLSFSGTTPLTPITDSQFSNTLVNFFEGKEISKVDRKNLLRERKCTPAPKSLGRKFKKNLKASSPKKVEIIDSTLSSIQPSGDMTLTPTKLGTSLERKNLSKTEIELDPEENFGFNSTIDSIDSMILDRDENLPVESFRSNLQAEEDNLVCEFENELETLSKIDSLDDEVVQVEGEDEDQVQLQASEQISIEDSHAFLNQCQEIDSDDVKSEGGF